jgi:pyruvate kinase
LSTHRLVATLGPSSFDSAEALVEAGATEFRLNASHLTPLQVRDHLLRLREVLPMTRCVVDLQGKKMRIGSIEPRQLELGDRLAFSNDPDDTHSIFVPHPELFEQIALTERITLDDNRIELELIERTPRGFVGMVRRAGILRARKGINRQHHPIELHDLAERDLETIAVCLDQSAVAFAVSFASDGAEAAWVRKRAPHCPVVLKVERREALDNLSALADETDELWICRGDLGAQLGLTGMARAVASVEPRNHSCPILMAGQVLQHLCEHDTPTRSEVCHLHELLERGYAGIVLSDETAVGRAPVAAVRWAARLMRGEC